MKIILCSVSDELKELASHRLSNIAPYQVFTCKTSVDVLRLLNKEKISALYYETHLILPEDRAFLKSIALHYPDTEVILFANRKFAYDAWGLGATGFSSFPMGRDNLKDQFQKRLNADKSRDKTHKLSFKTKEGVFSIKVSEVKYIFAQNNKSIIHCIGKRMYSVNTSIGKYDNLCDEYLSFSKVHRSMILNTSLIRSVKGQIITFVSDDSKVKVSAPLGIKIRKILLGKI